VQILNKAPGTVVAAIEDVVRKASVTDSAAAR
jgi:hypothetical protein